MYDKITKYIIKKNNNTWRGLYAMKKNDGTLVKKVIADINKYFPCITDEEYSFRKNYKTNG